jgi:hypothetical protein
MKRKTKIFKINKIVDLRLKHKKTYIYVNNKKFRLCVRLLLDIPVNKFYKNDEIKSVDEAAEVFNQTLLRNIIIDNETQKISRNHDISPEEEFKGHCSNIQAFFENGLNTDILASNIAFPLLKKLVDCGYKPARRVFKEEIAKRYIEGTYRSKRFLSEEGYLNYLNEEEKQVMNFKEIQKWEELTQQAVERDLEVRRKFKKIKPSSRCINCNEHFFGDYPKIDDDVFQLCPKCFDTLHSVVREIENIFDDNKKNN